jgi:transcriptional regulator with XRE-family HTH domain
MQCRAARAALRLSIPGLAKRAELGQRSVSQFESEGRATSTGTKAALRYAFEGMGVTFPDEWTIRYSAKAMEIAAEQLGAESEGQ